MFISLLFFAVLYNPPSRVLKAVKTFSGITADHSSTKGTTENQPSGTPLAMARPVDAVGEHTLQEEMGGEIVSCDSNNTNSGRSVTDIPSTEHLRSADK